MPTYDFQCPSCSVTFEEKRMFAHADDPAVCPQCGNNHAAKVISTVAFYSPAQLPRHSSIPALAKPRRHPRPMPPAVPVVHRAGRRQTGMSDSGTKKLSPDQHREIAAAQIGVVHIAIVTVSDSRTPETDTNAQYLRPAIEALGHVVSGYRLIKDEPDQVAAVLGDSLPRMRA